MTETLTWIVSVIKILKWFVSVTKILQWLKHFLELFQWLKYLSDLFQWLKYFSDVFQWPKHFIGLSQRLEHYRTCFTDWNTSVLCFSGKNSLRTLSCCTINGCKVICFCFIVVDCFIYIFLPIWWLDFVIKWAVYFKNSDWNISVNQSCFVLPEMY